MDQDRVISIQDIGKAYRIWDSPAARLSAPMLEGLANLVPPAAPWLTKRAAALYRDFWALKGISFEVKKGESIGIIGRNGAGKSTLLQIIAGTLQPTTGTIQVNGRVSALLELGSGFNPDFTGRENVYLNAAVLGLSRREVDERFDEIAAFADIGDFIEQPVKTYSSGMFVRLAFAVQTAVEPQVLIVDEALSVGDVFFQQRCYERMRKLLDSGVCVVLASHDLGSVQQFCQRTLVFQRGEAVFYGPSAEATKIYFQIEQKEKVAAFAAKPSPTGEVSQPPSQTSPATTNSRAASIPDWPKPENGIATSGCHVVGNNWARCSFIAVCNSSGEPWLDFRQGETMSVFYEFEILRDMEFCFGCITLRDKTNQAVHSKITLQDGIRAPARVTCGTRLRFRQDTVLNIACINYTVDVALEMISSDLLDQPGITYDEFMAAQLRICELHAAASFTVRLRDQTEPFQLLHFGQTGLPSHSQVEVITPVA